MDGMLELSSEPAVKRKPAPRAAGTYRKGKLDVRQRDLLPSGSILDYLEEDDPTFWLLELQETLPLSLFPESSVRGGFDYDPRMMFTLWLLSLWCGAPSSRILELLIRRDVRYIALAHGLRPDHSTLCRFRRSLGDSMGPLLAQSVELARKAGMVRFTRGHIDGHRLPGNVTQWRKLCQQAEAADAADESVPPSDGGGQAPVDSANSGASTLPATAAPDSPSQNCSAPATRDSSPPAQCRKKPRRPVGDPDARTIKTKKGFITGYNAQALADEESGIVLSATVSNNAADGAHLLSVLERCLELHAELPDSLAGDKGYDTPRNAHALEELGMESFIPAHASTVFTLSDDGRVVCPAGHEPNQFKHVEAKGVPVFRQVVTRCKTCPQARSCADAENPKNKREKPPQQRTIQSPKGVPVEPWLRMHARAAGPEGQAASKKRACTIERVFAHSKSRMGFTRFKLRGLALVELEWTMQMVAHNLWRIRSALYCALEPRLEPLSAHMAHFLAMSAIFQNRTSRAA